MTNYARAYNKCVDVGHILNEQTLNITTLQGYGSASGLYAHSGASCRRCQLLFSSKDIAEGKHLNPGPKVKVLLSNEEKLEKRVKVLTSKLSKRGKANKKLVAWALAYNQKEYE